MAADDDRSVYSVIDMLEREALIQEGLLEEDQAESILRILRAAEDLFWDRATFGEDKSDLDAAFQEFKNRFEGLV